MNKTSKLLYLIGGAMFASSFFVKDNGKAVKRRYYAIAVAGLGYAANYFKVSPIK